MNDKHWTTIINNGTTPPSKGDPLSVWWWTWRGVLVLVMLRMIGEWF